MSLRRAPLRNPARFTFDGSAFEGEAGESIAEALVAAENLTIARSPKFHRPRGPACFRAACDGCLARVNGVPNVMTCLHPLTDGAVVESQNSLGSRDIDLLRVTDWFFPDGLNHHELFAGVPGVQSIMQSFARRVAGLGKVPTHEPPPARSANRREVDCLVVGGGPAGMIAATALSEKGRRVEVIDDALALGGGARAVGVCDRFAAVIEAFQVASRSGVTVRPSSVAVGIFGEDVLVVSPARTELLRAKTLVLATGAHDGVLPFEGNDLPGILSARATGWLLAHGVVPGSNLVIVSAEDAGPFGQACADALQAFGAKFTHVAGAPLQAKGSSRVKAVVVRDQSGSETKLACDLLVIDAPRSPSYELAIQVGATVKHESAGYVVDAPNGKIRDGVFAVGELVGTPLDLDAMLSDVRRAMSGA